MWELDYKESWASKNWYFRIVVLEKALESPLDYKEIKQVNPKGNQSWIFIGRTGAETEVLILWPLLPRADSPEKTLMLWKIECKQRSGWQRMRRSDSLTYWMDKNLSKFREIVENSGVWSAVIHGVANNWTRLSNCKTTAMHILYNYGLFSVCVCVCVLSPSVVSDCLWLHGL